MASCGNGKCGGPRLVLSNGTSMPQVGLGTWQSSDEEVKRAVITAIDAGYRLIDTAIAYYNEGAIGEALQECIKAGKIEREDVFITTKLWSDHVNPIYVESELRASLERLQTDYVDLFLVHMPAAYKPGMKEMDKSIKVEDTWRGMEEVYKKGLAKAIGVSNHNIQQIERIMKIAAVPIHVLQVEMHLYFRQKALAETCKKHNITMTSYASLGSPGRSKYQMPNGHKPKWEPAPSPMDDADVKTLAEKYKKTPAQILLRYIMDRGFAVIPKSVTPSRVVENFQLFDFSLSADEIARLEKDKLNKRLFLQEFMEGHPEDPYLEDRKPK